MTSPLGRGRGRGRGNTLPAWMTRGDGPGVGVVGSSSSGTGIRGSGRGRGSISGANPSHDRSGSIPDRDRDRDRDRDINRNGSSRGRGGDRGVDNRPHRDRVGGGGGGGAPPHHRDRDRDLRDVRGRGGGERNDRRGDGGPPPDRDRDHVGRGSGRDGRGYSRDRHEMNRERDRERSHRDRREDDRDVRRSDMRRNDHPPAANSQQRGHHGLGYDNNARGHGDRDTSWERDRGGGMGRGRGRGRPEEMNFVRGGVVGGDRDDRDGVRNPRDYRDEMGRDRDIGRDRDVRERDRGDSNMGMGSPNSSNHGMGMGRGRGRGVNINKPAWMTTSGPGPVGFNQRHGESSSRRNSSPHKEKDRETMEQLLAQARKVQKEQTQSNDQHRDTYFRRESKATGSSRKDGNGQNKSSSERNKDEELTKQQLEAEKAKQERELVERMREEEEQRQLRALVGDLSDDEKKVDDYSDGISRKKRKGVKEEDDEEVLFEFETEEEREERLARKRREERRKKMRKLEQVSHTVVGREEHIKVDQPRNVAGVIQSELNDTLGGHVAHDVMEADATTKIDVVSNQFEKDVGNDNGTKSNGAGEEHDSDDSDSFDIFAADNATPIPTSKNAMSAASNKRNNTTANNAQECDDAEGYYKANIGEIITLPKERRDDYDYNEEAQQERNIARFRVLGIIGKGVFSSVIKCVEEKSTLTADSENVSEGGRIIAMKVIRNNEIMSKAAAKEMRILRMLCRQQRSKLSVGKLTKSKKEGNENDNSGSIHDDEEEDPEERERRERENHHIVRLLDVDPAIASSNAAYKDNNPYSTSAYASTPPPEFRHHPIFLFEFLPYNLREVLSKFGKNVGINLTAVRSYARQLLCALGHLERHRVVHADLKPDNILVSANFSTIKLADFGSAFFETDHDNDPTPYLVSRFYRPPEVIMGLEYDRMVDLWSAATTLAELFTGSVLFPGQTNNDMLVRFMDAMGPFSHKMVKRHAASYIRIGLQPHFEVGQTGGTYQLRKQDVDRVTGQPVCRLVNVLSAKAESRLAQVLLRASKGGGGTLSSGERVDVLKFADFLNRCLALDPARRLSVRDALRHDFFVKKKKREDP